MDYYNVLKPFIFRLSPEMSHNAAIMALRANLLPAVPTVDSQCLRVKLFGLEFPNPVGLAAGFDKNGDAIDSLFNQGFGFVEVGTVTPKPQSGNDKPRLFRLTEDEAVINRFGFNNKGVEHFVANLNRRQSLGIVGANIGKNKDSEDAVKDYIFLLDRIYGSSDYITINISSPNTPGLRDLQRKDELSFFLESIMASKTKLIQKTGKDIAILLKLAPDTNIEQRQEIAEILCSIKVDGIIVSNTTIDNRDALKSSYANETGGLSGKPLFGMSTQMIGQMYKMTQGKIPIIGVGGISSARDAYTKIRAGASLVQLYSALVFHGFGLVTKINTELEEMLQKDGFSNVLDAVGADSTKYM